MRKLKKAFWLAGAGAVAITLLFASAQCQRQAYEMSHDDLVAALHKGDRSRKYHIISELAARRDKRAAKPLIAALNDPNPRARSEVIGALGRIGDRRAVAPLIGALKDPDLNVRFNAAYALGALGDKQAVVPLISAIENKPMMPRLAAIKALGKLRDKRAVGPLIEVLRDKRTDLRTGAATALGWIGPPAADAIDPLIELLAQGYTKLPVNPVQQRFKPPSLPARKALAASARQGTHAPLPPPPNVGAIAARALAWIGKAAVEPLIAALKDKRAAVRGYAATALSEIGGERAAAALARLRDDREPFVRFSALQALVTLKAAQAEEAVVASLRDAHPRIRSLAILMLAKTDNARKSDLLLGCLKDQNAEVRLTTARALGETRDKKAVRPLAALLGDKDYMVRMAAAEAMAWIRSREAVPALLAAIKEPVPQVERGATRAQVQAVQALGSLGDPAAVAGLIDVLQDEGRDIYIRHHAALALGQIGDPAAVARLIDVLQDERRAPRVRGHAVLALGLIGDLRAVEPLIRELNILGANAVQALGRLGDKRATKPIIDAFRARMVSGGDAAAALALIKDPRAVRFLIGLLNDKNGNARRRAIGALGAIGDRAAVGPLIAKLSHRYDGMDAARALGRLNDARAVGPLIRLLKRAKPKYHRSVARSLANIDSPSTARALEGLLGSSNVNHRHGAVVALGALGKVDPVIRAMKDSERNIRLAAAKALSTSDDPRATRALIPALKHQDSGIRMYAAFGLGYAKEPSDVVALLIDALADENATVRGYALRSLRRITKKDFRQDQEKWRLWWEESRKP